MAEHTTTLTDDVKAELRTTQAASYDRGRRTAQRHATTPSRINPTRTILSGPDYAERMAADEWAGSTLGKPSPIQAAYWLGYAEATLYVHTLDGEPCEGGPAVPDDALCAEHGRLYRSVR